MVTAKKNILTLGKKLNIEYSVYFIENIFSCSGGSKQLANLCKDKKIMLVVDENVHRIYGEKIEDFFRINRFNYLLHTLNATERNKNISTVTKLCEMAKKFRLQRNSLFVGIGGGITMDIVGLSAFLFRRHIAYIKIPTTLVGLVDAGVGVKVGVNFNESKNILGGYHLPRAVFNDQSFIKTLTLREIRCGLYEILKIAIIKDKSLFEQIETQWNCYTKKTINIQTDKINRLASFLMMQELEPDLFESNLERIVDFGHTFSPFIETSSKYIIPHGEAVGIDILISSFLSLNRGILSESDFDRILSLIKSIGFSNNYTLPPLMEIYSSLSDVRNHRGGNLNLVIPSGLGSAIFINQCSVKELDKIISSLLETKLFSFGKC